MDTANPPHPGDIRVTGLYKYSAVTLGAAVFIGGALLLRYLHIQGLETIFPVLLDQTALFLVMGAMAGLLALLLALFFYSPLFLLSGSEISDDSSPSVSTRDKILCWFGLLEWSRTSLNQLKQDGKSPSGHLLGIQLVSALATTIAWVLPAAALQYGFVGVASDFWLVAIPCMLIAVWILGCLFQPRLWGTSWLPWLFFILFGLLTSGVFALLLVHETGSDASSAVGELAAVMLVSVFYAVMLTALFAARYRGIATLKINAYGLLAVVILLALLIPNQLLTLAGRSAGLEAQSQQVILPWPLPLEFSTPVTAISGAARTAKSRPSLAVPEMRSANPSSSWNRFATVFHFGAVDVLCNPSAGIPGGVMPQTCMVIRDGKLLSRFERLPR